MFDMQTWLAGLAGMAMLALAGWLVSLVKRDVSIVDSLWSIMFVVGAAGFWLSLEQHGTRSVLMVALVTIWALRLSGYILWRNWGEGEDYRYRAMRRKNAPNFAFKSLYIVFGLQGALAWIISLPVLAAMNSSTPLGVFDYLGIGLWVLGLVFEAGGDYQLARFRSQPENEGKVLDTGLWRYTRHPNYFGDCCVWWGFYLIAVGGGGAWSIVSPLLMTFLLLKVSGVAMLEKTIGDRRPEYATYVRQTSAFIPWMPSTVATEGGNDQ